MKRTPYLRFLGFSVLWAAVFSAISLFCLIRFSSQAGIEHRKEFLLSLGAMIEQKPLAHSLEQLPFGRHHPFGKADPDHHGPPPWEQAPGPGGPGSGHGADFGPGKGPGGNPGFGADHHHPPGEDMPPPPHPSLWIVNEQRDVIDSNEDPLPPAELQNMRLPSEIHDIASSERFLSLQPGLLVLRLNSESPAFLVLSENHDPFHGPMFLPQLLFSFGTVLTGVFLALVLTFLYLKHKSSEAKAVLLQLENGDLKARFQIRRFDELGSLMLDFNRMATEIEHLVSRIHATETARKNLLQELGHDLRTPLTSIKTAFETLKKHFGKMTDAQREELFDVVGTEVSYFQELLEKLITIASLDEPHYKHSTELIDVLELLSTEVRARTARGDNQLTWTLTNGLQPGEDATVLGDPNLILRLFKNALDNASRFANRQVAVTIATDKTYITIAVADDGSGLTPAELEGFGKRRQTRVRPKNAGVGFSIGLGSVIMTAIAKLHAGDIAIENGPGGANSPGAILKIRLPHC